MSVTVIGRPPGAVVAAGNTAIAVHLERGGEQKCPAAAI